MTGRCFWFAVRGFFGLEPMPYHGDYRCYTKGQDASLIFIISVVVLAVVGIIFFAGRASAMPYTCADAKQYRAVIIAMPDKELRAWIKALGLSRKQVREARRCLRG